MKQLKNKSNILSEKGSVNSTISCDIVRYFQKQGLTLKEIGKLMDLSESSISKILHKQRNLTLQVLSRLENVTNKPLPIILLEATETDSIPKELRKGYEAFRRILMDLGETA